jgi:hypothetical protein
VSCSSSDNHHSGGRVTEINLSSNNLNGALPPTLGFLSELTKLYIDGTQPTSYEGCDDQNFGYSAIPDSFYWLKNLQVFSAEDACLGGSLNAAAIANLTNLVEFSIHQNRISGVFPAEFDNCPNLEILKLDRNPITGQVPLFTNLKKLQTFDCNFCSLSGPFPEIDFASIPDLNEMYWDGNLFTSLPSTFSGLSALTEISFDINNITGPFPSGLCNSKKLTDCRVGSDTSCAAYQAFVFNHESSFSFMILLYACLIACGNCLFSSCYHSYYSYYSYYYYDYYYYYYYYHYQYYYYFYHYYYHHS